MFAANISSLSSSTFSAGYVPVFGRKRAKGQTLLFHRIIPWRLSTDISLFLSVVISLDMKYAFHYLKKKQKNTRPLVSLATESLTTEANFGAARYYRSKT